MNHPRTLPPSPVSADVRAGLTARPRRLPSYLFYDARGSSLYERITELPEYYPTRTERAILARHAAELVAAAAEGSAHPLHVVELGAGSASKTLLVLEALIAQQGRCVYLPVDVSASALEMAKTRIEATMPAVTVRPLVGHHDDAFEAIRDLGPRRLVLFIGSSIGNYDDHEAIGLLRSIRGALLPGGTLLLGTDLRKDPARLVAAYDDAQGVTAAFNLNVLTRINRELDADFDLAQFRHVALWNEAASRVEMHLESRVDQRVFIGALDLPIDFVAGERIHTESSVKYDLPHVDRLLTAAGFGRVMTRTDDAGLFAVHLARALSDGG